MRTARQRHILAALYAGNAAPEVSPVQVQKLFFLIDREAAPLSNGPHFGFEPYDYGPFDHAVYAELEALRMLGDIEVDRSGSHRIYRLTDTGKQNAAEALAALNDGARAYFGQAKDWVKSLGFRDLVSAIYKAYPDTKAKSIFRG